MSKLDELFPELNDFFSVEGLCKLLLCARKNPNELNDLAKRVIDALRDHSDTLLTTRFSRASLLLTALECNHLTLTQAILEKCSVDLMRHAVDNVAPLDLATDLFNETENSAWGAVMVEIRTQVHPAAIGELEGRVTALEARASRRTRQIRELKTEVAGLKTDLRTEKEGRQADVSRLQGELQTQATDHATALEAQATAHTAEIQALRTDHAAEMQALRTDHAAEMQALRTELGLAPRSPVSQSAGAAEPSTPPHVPAEPQSQPSPASRCDVTRREFTAAIDEIKDAIRAGAARAPPQWYPQAPQPFCQPGYQQFPPNFSWYPWSRGAV